MTAILSVKSPIYGTSSGAEEDLRRNAQRLWLQGARYPSAQCLGRFGEFGWRQEFGWEQYAYFMGIEDACRNSPIFELGKPSLEFLSADLLLSPDPQFLAGLAIGLRYF